MNPWTILAGLLLAISLFGGGYYKGHVAGVNEQKVANQKAIDEINAKIAEQKAIANQKAIEQRDQVIALQVERDKFKKQLGEQHVKNQELTDRNADLLAAYSLRFRADIASAGGGAGAGSGEGAGGGAAGDATSAIIQLPAALEADLRRLVKDADDLNDDYKLCYGYAQRKVEGAKLE
jgi:hypothetical protein